MAKLSEKSCEFADWLTKNKQEGEELKPHRKCKLLGRKQLKLTTAYGQITNEANQSYQQRYIKQKY